MINLQRLLSLLTIGLVLSLTLSVAVSAAAEDSGWTDAADLAEDSGWTDAAGLAEDSGWTDAADPAEDSGSTDAADPAEDSDSTDAADPVDEDDPDADDLENDGAGRAVEPQGADADAPDWTDDLGEGTMAGAAEGLEVYFLDLGRVDGILIRCDGETSFIDVGFEEDATPAIKYLKYLGVDHLDSYIASHGHSDHVGGAARVIDALKPEKLYLNRAECLNAILEKANGSQAATVKATEAVVLRPGDTFDIGSAHLKCLAPLTVKNCSTDAYSENYNSMILRMDYSGHSFLFTGDTTDNILRRVNQYFPGEIDVDVLKNPHHNGKHDPDVINLISPKLTVFCTENARQPVKKYQAQLKAQGSAVRITGSEHDGNIAIVCRGDDMEVRCGYPMTEVTLKPVPVLYTDQVYTLKGTLAPASLARPEWVCWKTSDPSVVRVANGRIKAVGQGTATVSATTLNGLTASVEVQTYSALVEAEQPEVRIAVGEEKKLRAKIIPEGRTGITGEWVSADPSILVVMPNGEIIGAKTGTTQAIARLSNGAEAVCNVTVAGFPVDSITLDRKKVKMKVGSITALKATVKPDYFADMQLEWASSNEKVAWVDQSGNVTAVGRGTAKIGVRASDSKYAVCTVKVE